MRSRILLFEKIRRDSRVEGACRCGRWRNATAERCGRRWPPRRHRGLLCTPAASRCGLIVQSVESGDVRPILSRRVGRTWPRCRPVGLPVRTRPRLRGGGHDLGTDHAPPPPSGTPRTPAAPPTSMTSGPRSTLAPGRQRTVAVAGPPSAPMNPIEGTLTDVRRRRPGH